MSKQNNNESYKLLDMSGDTASEDDLPEIVVTPKKKKVKRRVRRPRSNSIGEVANRCSCDSRSLSFVFVAILLVTWVVTLTWLAIVLNSELQRVDSAVKKVVASSQEVPGALQKCHTVSKELQQNQTLLTAQVSALKLRLENVTQQIQSIQSNLDQVEEKIKSIPVANVPEQDISQSVANFGSQIKDLLTTVTELKGKLDSDTSALTRNVTDLRQLLSVVQNTSQNNLPGKETSDIKEALLQMVSEVSKNVTKVNETLSNNLQWLKDDFAKNHKTVDQLVEAGQNMSARVTTLEGSCKKVMSDHGEITTDLNNLKEQVAANIQNFQKVESDVLQLQSGFSELSKNETIIKQSLNDMNQMVNQKASGVDGQTTLSQDAMYERSLQSTSNTPSTVKEIVSTPIAPKSNETAGKPLMVAVNN